MKKSTQTLIRVNLKHGNNLLACELALRGSVDNNGDVYLPNAYEFVKSEITPAQWSGYVSALAKLGKYRRVDGDFGTML